MVCSTSLDETLTGAFKEKQIAGEDERTKEELEKLIDAIEQYMKQWSRRESYNEFKIFQSIYSVLCCTVKRKPKELMSLIE